MNNKDFKCHMSYEVLRILVVLALLLFICRLWPILLLVILGILIAALRLLFLSARTVEVLPPLLLFPARIPSERDVQELAYGIVQQRITELVSAQYPHARWAWKTPEAKANIIAGKDVSIMLNRAGGYRQAHVVIHGLQVCGLAFQHVPEQPNLDSDSIKEPVAEAPRSVEQETKNYEYIAFEWVDAHAMELNDRCNESLAKKEQSISLAAETLPIYDSWPDICRELRRNGIEDCECTDKGITIHLKQ